MIKNFPALALMCYLINNGCPWRRPFTKGASAILNDEILRKIFSRYCIEVEAKGVNDVIRFCILCFATNTKNGVIRYCGHACKNICILCVSRVFRCPTCGKPNEADGKSQIGDERMFNSITGSNPSLNVATPDSQPGKRKRKSGE